MTELHTEPTDTIRQRVDELCGVQKRNPPASAAWQEASEKLQPLFRELARRQKSGEVIR